MLQLQYTGVRSGETLIAHKDCKQAHGSIMEVSASKKQDKSFKLVYPPQSDVIKQLSTTDKRDKMTKLDFFKDMSEKEITSWLKKNETHKAKLFLDHTDVWVKFIKLDGADINKRLSAEDRDLLLNGEFHKLSKVSYMFNESGKKSNMIFRPNNWVVAKSASRPVKFKGIIVNIDGTSDKFTGKISPLEYAIVGKVGIAVRRPTENGFKDSDIDKLLDKYKISDTLVELLKPVSASVHKSLIQKVIRTRASKCDFLGEDYEAEKVLICSFLLLCRHPGYLNTNIQVYERGILSAVKRAGISIAEDSSIGSTTGFLSLFACAMLIKTFVEWRPSVDCLKKFVTYLVEALESKKTYKYKTSDSDDELDDLKVSKDPLTLAYYLIDEIKALRTDIPMIGWIAKNKGATRNCKAEGRCSINIPIYHAIDHHNTTAIGWHIDKKYVGDTKEAYMDLFGRMWRKCSYANPRKGHPVPSGKFVNALRIAQAECWIMMYNQKIPFEISFKTNKEIVYTLTESWIGGILGGIKHVKVGRSFWSIINPKNPLEISTVVVHSRDEKKEYEMTDEEKNEFRVDTLYMLKKGITVTPPPSLAAIYPKLTISRKKDIYYVSIPGEDPVEWSEFARLTTTLPVVGSSDIDPSYNNGNFIQNDWESVIAKNLGSMDSEVRARLGMYLTGTFKSMDLFPITRTGESEKKTVSGYDTRIYDFFRVLATVAPAGFELTLKGFIIRDSIVAWSVLDSIKKFLSSSSDDKRSKWKTPYKEGQILFHNQQNILQEIIKDDKNGKTKNVVWMTTGLGKTRVVIHFIDYLIANNKMPKYCIYSLPSAAYNTVLEQFQEYKIPHNRLDITKYKTANHKIKPWVVNFVKHHHIKNYNFSEDVLDIAHDTYFIVDECHLSMTDSQTSSTALLLGSAVKYLTAMTGTLIRDEKYHNLIQWLRFSINFDITKHNMWTAIGGLISSHVNTKIKVIRRDIPLHMSDKQKAKHDKSFRDAVDVCYEVVFEGIIEQVLRLVKKKIGVFVVARNSEMQNNLRDKLMAKGIKKSKIHLITADTPINYTPKSKTKLDVIITTVSHPAGYSITGMHTMITSVYFTNQTTRTQLDARINRLTQDSEYVEYITLHCGLLSYIMERYDRIRSEADALKGFGTMVSTHNK